MTVRISPEPSCTTNRLLATILLHCKSGERVQFLVDPRSPDAVVQRLRVALSRSRNRNRNLGRKVEEFTLRHEIYPYTDAGGIRHACIVMWIEKQKHHMTREILDDLMER